MKILHNKFLIISILALLLGISYLYFSHDLNSKDIAPIAFGASLTSSNQSSSEAVSSEDEKISSDISFLTTLVSLKKIKIDTSLFTNKYFNRLQNNAVKIEKVVPGRINPFAPMGVDSVNTTTPSAKIITDSPTQITDKTAILNGTINVSGATDIHFEYGTTPQLNIITPTVKQSLVGTFIKNVLGLTSKTNYFYKACAKVNNTPLCGEVISFTTN